MNVHGELRARGGNAFVQNPGDAGTAGVAGVAGSNGQGGHRGNESSGNGGHGGKGGDGEKGGDGGKGGAGGLGGGGAGGSIKLCAPIIDAAGAIVDVDGGFGGSDGGPGRILFAPSSDSQFVGAEQFAGPQVSNPHLAEHGFTPVVPGLWGGGAAFGLVPEHNAGSFPDVVASAPAHSWLALFRSETGLEGFSEPYPGWHWLFLINLTCETLPEPMLGVGAPYFLQPLLEGGIEHNPEFYGTGPVPLPQFAPWLVYATLVPENAADFNAAFVTHGGLVSAHTEALPVGSVLYLQHESLACGAIPAPTLSQKPLPTSPPQTPLPAMDHGLQNAVTVTLTPPEAVEAGARWSLASDGAFRGSGTHLLPAGPATMHFAPVPGWLPPPDRPIQVEPPGTGEQLIEAVYRPAPVYGLGEVPPLVVYHGDVLGFGVDCGRMEFIGTAPRGTVQFANGWFMYEPDPQDRTPFEIRFIAADGGSEQVVRIEPRPNLLPEQNMLFLKSGQPPDPTGRDYLVIHETKVPDELNFRSGQESRVVGIAGHTLVFAASGDTTLYDRVHDHQDVKELNLFADTVIIRSSLKLQQSKVTVYARDLRFEGDGAIDTTPVATTTAAADGLPGGNITLRVAHLWSEPSTAPRFILRGGDATAGNGGDAGTLSALFDNALLLAELQGGGSGNGTPGEPGAFSLVGDDPVPSGLGWIHPLAVRQVLLYAKELYFNGYLTEAGALLDEYLGILQPLNGVGIFQLPSAPAASVQLAEMEQDARNLSERLASNLDYFGNPPGWVPMLSFEVNYMLTANEIESSMESLYLSYWLGRKAADIEQAQQGLADLKTRLNTENSALKDELDDLTRSGGVLEQLTNEAMTITNRIHVLTNEFALIEQRLLRRAEEIVEQKNRVPEWKRYLRLAGAVVQAVPVLQPWNEVVGSGLELATRVDEQDPLTTFAQGADLFSGIAAGHLAGKAAELRDLQAAGADPSSQEASALEARAGSIAELGKSLHGIADSLKAAQQGTQVPAGEVQAELAKLREADPQFKEVAEKLADLSAQKELFACKLAAAQKRLMELPSLIARNYLGMGAADRAINDNNGYLDPQVLSYLRDLEQRSKERLRKYQYWLAKAYQYRLLEPYTGNLDLTGLFDDLRNLAEADENQTNRTLSQDDFNTLSAAFRESLKSLADSIWTRLNQNAPEQSVSHIAVGISQSDLAELNETGRFRLNLMERGIFSTDREGLRLTGLRVRSIGARIDGADAGDVAIANVQLNFSHSGLSRLSREGVVFLFNHYRTEAVNPIVWSAEYDALLPDAPINHSGPSAASQSLLATLLDDDPDNTKLLKYSRPAAWADIQVTREFLPQFWSMPFGDVTLELTNLVLEIDYDYFNRPSTRAVIEVVVPDGLMPRVLVSNADISGRQDAVGSFIRSYNRSGAVTLTTEASVGSWNFQRWQSQTGQSLSTTPSVTVNLTQNYRLSPVYTNSADLLPPTVVSMELANQSSEELEFLVDFSEDVVGVDPEDFVIQLDGLRTGAVIRSVSGTGGQRLVRVAPGTGPGLLALKLKDDDSIQDFGGNSLGGPGAENADASSEFITPPASRVRLRATGLSPQGTLVATIEGQAGATYQVETSPNLVDWEFLQEATMTDTNTEVELPLSTTDNTQFYRVRVE